MTVRKRYFLWRGIGITTLMLLGFWLCSYLYDYNKIPMFFFGVWFGIYWLFILLDDIGLYFDSQRFKDCPKCGCYFREKPNNIVECIACNFTDIIDNQKIEEDNKCSKLKQ